MQPGAGQWRLDQVLPGATLAVGRAAARRVGAGAASARAGAQPVAALLLGRRVRVRGLAGEVASVLGLGEGAGGIDLQRERGGGRHHLWGDGGGGGAQRRRRGEGERRGCGTHEAHGADGAGQLVVAVEEVSLEGLLEGVVVVCV